MFNSSSEGVPSSAILSLVRAPCESELTLMLRQTLPLCCTLVVNLKNGAVLKIKTTATHAVEVLGGRTALPQGDTQIFDSDGHPLKDDELLRLTKAEQFFWRPSKLTDPS